VLDVVLSAEVATRLQEMRPLKRRLVRRALEHLGRPADFDAMRPLVGRKHWFTTDIGPYVVSCRLLDEREARTVRASFPALYVVTVDDRDMLRAAADRLIPTDD
jgi:hypothetical protein